ncbi:MULTISPECIES: hypothetical protein [unclassified Bartonella]|uniref:hypothetical protein n=1 Tax=unclassified Bartonella TaxID=2645622 RepID=UPI0035CF44C9
MPLGCEGKIDSPISIAKEKRGARVLVQRDGAIKNRLLVLLLGNGLVSFGGWIDYIVILTVSVFTWKADQYNIPLIGAATLFPGIILSTPIGMLINHRSIIHWLCGRYCCYGHSVLSFY